MGLKCVGRFGCGSERARPGFWRNSVGVVGIFAAGDPGWLVPRDPGLEGAAPLGLAVKGGEKGNLGPGSGVWDLGGEWGMGARIVIFSTFLFDNSSSDATLPV